MRWTTVPLAAAVTLLTLLAAVTCQNIDTNRPILRTAPATFSNQMDSLFGYSLVLHQTAVNPADMQDALDGARIIVSAPAASIPSARVIKTGAIFQCPVTQGSCSSFGDGPLFDTDPNNLDNNNRINENKTNQFLGSSMASNGDRFIVCAHRHTRVFYQDGITYPFPLGKCYYINGRALDGTLVEYEPCFPGGGRVLATYSVGVCQAGVSASIVENGNSFAFGVGGPGIVEGRGALIRRDSRTQFQSTDANTENFAYQGYAIATGNFLTQARQDFAVSIPRRNSYFGSVNLVINNRNLGVTSQPLAGMQMGEYYGFSLVAADLNGDGFDELLVGAPLYRANSTEPETGRVFLYRNTGGNLQLARIIEGFTRYSRFGYAMANLGDINGDNFDDIAISAPFSDAGTVYIYHSSPNQLLTTDPQQRIRASDLSLLTPLTDLRGFGTSLASGVDVDLNTYNDLLIGSFMTQRVVLLRTRPLARVQTSLSTNLLTFDTSVRSCDLNGDMLACLDVRACGTYTGRGLGDTLPLIFTVNGDTENLERRIIFNNNMAMISSTVTARRGQQSCTDFITAYLRDGVLDIFNPFVFTVSVATQETPQTPGDGNQQPNDLSGFPVVTAQGQQRLQVETRKECGGEVCVPNLITTVLRQEFVPSDPANVVVAGLTSTVNIYLDVTNDGEDAFQATLIFTLPSLLGFVNMFNQTANGGEVTLSCPDQPVINPTDGSLTGETRYDCSLGSLFSGPGNLQLRLQLNVRDQIIGSEDDVTITFNGTTINPEDAGDLADNVASTTIGFGARASISIDQGIVMPEQISYSNIVPINIPNDQLNLTSDLGPLSSVSYIIRNAGPSRVPNILFTVNWPLSGPETDPNFFLYVTSIPSDGAATVNCENANINRLNLTEVDVSDGGEGGVTTPTVIVGSRQGRRRRSAANPKRNIVKRQEPPNTAEESVTNNRMLSCAENNPNLDCVELRCNILGLPGGQNAQIDINARVDERFFSTSNDRFIFVPTAEISIVDGDFITSNGDGTNRMATAQISIIPAARVSSPRRGVPWWAIFLPILAAVIVIAVVSVLLWVFGFFRRRKHEEIKQKKEELQNLADFGTTPGGPDGTNL